MLCPKEDFSPIALKQPKICFKTMLFFTFMWREGGGSVTVMSNHRSCLLVPAKGMSRSAGHCFLKNVKLQGLEDRWFRGLTEITYRFLETFFI